MSSNPPPVPSKINRPPAPSKAGPQSSAKPAPPSTRLTPPAQTARIYSKDEHAVLQWVQGLDANQTDVPGVLRELISDRECAKVLVPHLKRLCDGPERTGLESGSTDTGAEFSVDDNRITLSKVDKDGKTLNRYHQFWNFLYESCNAAHKEEYKDVIAKLVPTQPGSLKEYGVSMSDHEAKCADEFGKQVEMLVEAANRQRLTFTQAPGTNPAPGQRVRLEGTFDDSTRRHMDVRQSLKQTGRSLEQHFRDTSHDHKAGIGSPAFLCSHHYFMWEAVGNFFSEDVQTLLEKTLERKGVLARSKIKEAVGQAMAKNPWPGGGTSGKARDKQEKDARLGCLARISAEVNHYIQTDLNKQAVAKGGIHPEDFFGDCGMRTDRRMIPGLISATNPKLNW